MRVARARLFATIEGGSQFWAREILRSESPSLLIERIIQREFDEHSRSAPAIADRILHVHGEEVIAEIESSGGFFLTPEDQDWPIQLADLKAPPFALVGRGQRQALSRLYESVSIVGTRNPTTYGVRIAGDFAAGVIDRGWTVISGGAYGIDAAAHRGALAAEGITCAVLASGIANNYPAGHIGLFDQITEEGVLLSEVMPKVPAVPARFLLRNRLIAALSRGTIVVEAAARSGSLRTAREAAEILRLVMAVPGSVQTPTSEGCHRLISERCAELVTSIGDVMDLVLPLTTE
jgi:DNA processing protein